MGNINRNQFVREYLRDGHKIEVALETKSEIHLNWEVVQKRLWTATLLDSDGKIVCQNTSKFSRENALAYLSAQIEETWGKNQ